MSTNATADEVASIIAEYAAEATANYCGIVGIVLIIYDYTITFGREVDLFWTKRFSGATVLFIANKYISLINHLFDLSLFLPIRVSDRVNVRVDTCQVASTLHSLSIFSCDLHAKLFSSVDYLQYVPWAAFSGLRAFALCKIWILSISIALLSLVPLGVNFSVKIYGVNDPDAGTCVMGEDLSSADAMKILLVLNVLHLAFTLTSVSANTSEITYFTEPLTAVLVSHFLLDLQATTRSAVRIHGSNLSPDEPTLDTRSVYFAQVVGTLGSTLDGPLPLSPESSANTDSTTELRTFSDNSDDTEAQGGRSAVAAPGCA
ncbi:uncharacterized protein BXZ73DRAFT_38142 [Epithele typhae]|uniref:uncharacterized protein n=1 Tax=Epithele typhae TaxID=378194 RepID=UPI0020073B71|nr:uncharacterized protein BXZ73DRAFT_38142 [Epithele typhae]KAH9944974.1 hypothetical protein BXZ73DRAFT_38142 [Epithele typhae]